MYKCNVVNALLFFFKIENEEDGAYKAESLQILGPTRTDGTSGDVWHLKSLCKYKNPETPNTLMGCNF